MERAMESEPQFMITGVTNIMEIFPSSEAEVEKKLSHLVESSSGLVVISPSNRDADRLRSAYRAARENGRKLALLMKQDFM